MIQQFEGKSDENAQLQIKLAKRMDEVNETTEECTQLKDLLKNKTDESHQTHMELQKLHSDIQLKNVSIAEQRRILDEKTEELKATKSALNWFKVEIDDKQNELQLREKDIQTRTLEIEELKKQLGEGQKTIEEKTTCIQQLQMDLEQKQQTLMSSAETIMKREEDIQHLQKKLEERQREVEFKTNDLKSKKDQIQKVQLELEQRAHEVEGRTEELRLVKGELEQKMNEMLTMKGEQERLNFFFQKMKNAIPSSILMVDRDNSIINCNKKAEELFGGSLADIQGTNLFTFELMEKERLREGMQQCQKEKKPVTVKSVSMKNHQGNRFLTDIQQIPLLDNSGELQGTIMVFVDVSDVAEAQAKLVRTEEEFRILENRFQQNNTKLKVVDMEKNAMSTELMKMKTEFETRVKERTDMKMMFDGKQKELDHISESIALKLNELNTVTIKLDGFRSVLELLESERKQKKGEADKPLGVPSDAWKEKLKIYDEIDKCLNITDDGLKTKKLKDNESK
jgi:PAS domain S-box-containing protein